jgi:hypothetical protein
MVWTRAVQLIFTLVHKLRAVYAAYVGAMVIGHVCHPGILVAFVGAVGNPPIEPALPISDTFLAAEIDAKVLRFKNYILGSNFRPDHVVEQIVS